jgi:hypothetical protein
MTDDARQWAMTEFGNADLGDTRRTARLVAMGAAAREHPSGKIAAVFGSDREREGAYDFLESKHVNADEITSSIAAATTARCKGEPFVFVPVDGTSISVVDRRHERDFGNVGNDTAGARGLKLIDALAVDQKGTTIGWLALTFWSRSPERERFGPQAPARKKRPLEEKETRHWVETIHAACDALDARGVLGCFLIDREGDSRDLLLALRETQHLWTVRGNQDRSIEIEGGSTELLRAQMSARAIAGTYELQVVARPGRSKRTANMVVRTAQVVLRLRDPKTKRIDRFPVNVVWAREEGTTPAKEDPIDWLLLTNQNVETFQDAQLVIYGYTQRWRVEECHRTWKSGECDVEATQLRSFASVKAWAIILGAVAARIERLKRLARQSPDSPASVELSVFEIRALKMLRFGDDADRPDPSIAQAVAWLAEMGGFTNKYSGKLPGATVLGRGLRRLEPAARLLALRLRQGR